ncbi:LysE family transporter [Falsigemmobacter faecalis]|uniref:LysE family transporter n=1 Tax=Falsigemmobacter faecalis TaxID=2488730 RepID=UPI00131571BC|nr:LysE family transporter [Falsigemmobacter faecalis]
MSIEQSLLALGGIFLLACCSPGPVFLLIASVSARSGRLAGLRVALGVAGATFVWSSLTVLGLGPLLASAVWAQTAIRIGAGLYLAWLGLMMMRSGLSAGPAREAQVPAQGSLVAKGFLTSITNPKALAFFGSAFALTAPDAPGLSYHLAAVAGLTGLSVVWHGLLALVFGLPALQRGYRGLKRGIDLGAGAILLTLGAATLAPSFRAR